MYFNKAELSHDFFQIVWGISKVHDMIEKRIGLNSATQFYRLSLGELHLNHCELP